MRKALLNPPFLRHALSLTILLSLTATISQAASTIHQEKPYIYSASSGWINTYADGNNGLTVYSDYLSGYAYAANLGWIYFGDGAPDDGIAYQNATSDDTGVNMDGLGNLTGYAYGANIGWIYFGDITNADGYQANFDRITGKFSGYAYSANVGWIYLGGEYFENIDLTIVDQDQDLIPDAWERTYFSDLETINTLTDYDNDGSSDYLEYLVGLNPTTSSEHFKLSIQCDENGTQLTHPHLVNGVSYVLECSQDLTSDEWTRLDYYASSDIGSYSFMHDHQQEYTKTFYRIAAQTSAPEIEVYILAGQSNGDGRSFNTEFDDAYLEAFENTLLYTDRYSTQSSTLPTKTWSTLQPGSSGAAARSGPELSLGRKLYENRINPDATIAIIKITEGATSLHTDWVAGGDNTTTGDGTLYSTLQSSVATALSELATDYPDHDIQLQGFFWVQGENDARSSFYNNYGSLLTTFCQDVRLTFDAPELPIHIAQLSDTQTAISSAGLSTVQLAQATIAANLDDTYAINTNQVTVRDDNLHYDANGLILLGELLAESAKTANTTD